MTDDHQIERRAAAALASGGTAGIDELDLILTDCAAESMALRAELLRVDRRLADLLGDDRNDLETLERVRQLAGRRSELSARSEYLSELLRELRARRDRLATG
jgi:hypothetical protein